MTLRFGIKGIGSEMVKYLVTRMKEPCIVQLSSGDPLSVDFFKKVRQLYYLNIPLLMDLQNGFVELHRDSISGLQHEIITMWYGIDSPDELRLQRKVFIYPLSDWHDLYHGLF